MDTDGLIEFATLERTQLFCVYSSIALIWYDYFLTFNQEIQEIWRRKFSWITILYHLNRYALLVNSVILFLMQFYWPGLTENVSFCANFLTTEKVLNVLVGVCAAVFNSIRIYALYGRHIWLFGFTLLLGIASPAINAYVWSITEPALGEIPGTGFACGVATSSISTDTYLDLLLGSRISCLAADSVVLVLTLAEGYKAWRLGGRSWGPSRTLKLMSQEGVLYYSVLVSLNILGIAVGRVTDVYAVVPLWVGVLTSILISHFILDLRTVFHTSTRDRSLTTMTMPMVVFKDRSTGNECNSSLESSQSQPRA